MSKLKRGENNVSIACMLEIHNAIKKFAGDAEQNNGFWLMKRALECIPELKAAIIEKIGEEKYQEVLKHYSKTNLQQRAERKLKEEEKRIREEAKLKIEQLRAEGYAKQSNVAEDKINSKKDEAERRKLVLEKRDIEEGIKFYKKFNEPEKQAKAEEELKEINRKLGD